MVKEGKVRALAVTGPKRSPIFPDLPTVAEAALPGYEAVLHYGIVAPAGTPQPIVEKLNAALRKAVVRRAEGASDRGRRRRAAAATPRGIRRRHRPRGDEVVGDREEIGRQRRSELGDAARGRCVAAFLLAAPASACGCRLSDPPDHAGRALPAGGGNDVMARIVADKMSKTLGQQIVVENRGGAGGTIATRPWREARRTATRCSSAAPARSRSTLRSIANVGYDPRKDFAPVGLIATSARSCWCILGVRRNPSRN